MLHGQPVKACPLCASPMAFSDQHIYCVTCLGVDHAVDALINRSSCTVCAAFQLDRLYDRIDKARKGEKLRQNRTVVEPEVGTGLGCLGPTLFFCTCARAFWGRSNCYILPSPGEAIQPGWGESPRGILVQPIRQPRTTIRPGRRGRGAAVVPVEPGRHPHGQPAA